VTAPESAGPEGAGPEGGGPTADQAAAEMNAHGDRWMPDQDTIRADLEALHVQRPGPRQAATQRIGGATRQLIERLVGTSAPVEELDLLAAEMESLAARLAPHTSRGRLYEGFAEASIAGRQSSFFDWSPFLGMANPLAPPIVASVEDGAVVGRVKFGAAYEGPPGCVHGGYVAAAFDEILGMAQTFSGRSGMTGTLEVRYRKPTPLHVDLRFEGRVQDVSGRKITVVGACYDGDVLTAESKGLFIAMNPAMMGQLLNERERRPI
jgi:acyl-coenzyme A thioesterase PaaI-like protein